MSPSGPLMILELRALTLLESLQQATGPGPLLHLRVSNNIIARLVVVL